MTTKHAALAMAFLLAGGSGCAKCYEPTEEEKAKAAQQANGARAPSSVAHVEPIGSANSPSMRYLRAFVDEAGAGDAGRDAGH